MGLSVADQVSELLARQRGVWPEAAARYAALEQAQLRELWLDDDNLVILQHNPARRHSAAAPVGGAAAPVGGAATTVGSEALGCCFLCRDHQPAEQQAVEWGGGRYRIQMNPYPILSRHLTISDTQHTPQSLDDPSRLADLLQLAADLPDYVVFYNGARCGASAPQHFHFQAGSRGMLPLCEELLSPACWPDERRLGGNADGFVAYALRQGRTLFFVRSSSIVQAQIYCARLLMAMMMSTGQHTEPMVNLLCWAEHDDVCVVIVPRRAHRPSNYGEGDGQLLLSPASVEMAGLWAVPRVEDFDALTPQTVKAIYDELCIDAASAVAIIDNFYKTDQLC